MDANLYTFIMPSGRLSFHGRQKHPLLEIVIRASELIAIG